MPQQQQANQQQGKTVHTGTTASFGAQVEGHAPTPLPTLSNAMIQRTRANPRRLAATDILQLQRTVGNQGVQRLLNGQTASPQGNQLLAHGLTRTTRQNAAPRIQRVTNKNKKLSQDQGAETGYLQSGGELDWIDDNNSSKFGLTTSRKNIRSIDKNLKRYNRYKSKNRGNAEEQANLLLQMKSGLENSHYQTDSSKQTKTFERRQQSTTILKREVENELKNSPARLDRVSDAEQIKELVYIGFTKKFLTPLAPADRQLLYKAHVALTFKQLGIAQQAFDTLSPVEHDQSGAIQYNPAMYSNSHYLKRSRTDLLYAQQLITARHHANVGGEYAKSFRHDSMTDPTKVQDVAQKYMRNKNFLPPQIIDNIKQGEKGAKTLDEVIANNRNLSPEEIEAIRIYSAAVFKQMNATMHDIRLDDPKKQKGFEGYSAISQLAMSGLGKLQSYTGTQVYRGDSNVAGMANTLRAGTTFLTPSFMSTSSKTDSTSYFGAGGEDGVSWVIKVSSKSRGKDISQISGAGEVEGEVLFPPGTKLKIVDVFRKDPSAGMVKQSKEDYQKAWRSDKGKPVTSEIYKLLTLLRRATLIIAQEV